MFYWIESVLSDTVHFWIDVINLLKINLLFIRTSIFFPCRGDLVYVLCHTWTIQSSCGNQWAYYQAIRTPLLIIHNNASFYCKDVFGFVHRVVCRFTT